MSAGIRWGALGIDMVPTFEEHIARLEKNYKIQEWYDLEEMERAMIIAVRRIDIASKNQQSEAEIHKAKQDARKAPRR